MQRANIDTDALSPSHFQPTELSKHGFKDALFMDWRRNPEFVLNKAPYDQASILVVGPNFGCGSSRETAVWALRDAGFRAVIAPGFASIFETNCIRNGLLPLVLPPEIHQQLAAETFDTRHEPRIRIDLVAGEVGAVDGPRHPFAIDERSRNQLISGLDAIGQTLLLRNRIDDFRRRDQQQRPWIYHCPITTGSETP
ncbi:3-isopropylmalate dehydratase small subunit [Mycolicibacter icosiumassiliensis]|uniref:3-isopropylmalate dehydratase small subunit n=1 Tax=Mycolicibacter icosiumassiliensis TaxID=1792835 RepID=UPI001F30852D|nr:3-isopropylmalate dehydratase small subunit [Mycolicibacter icosiumassiliensis]